MRVVYTGSPGSGKTRSLVELFNQARATGRERDTLFVVPDSSAREHIRDIIARYSPENVPAAFSDAGIHSLQSIIRKLAGTPSAGDSCARALLSAHFREHDSPGARRGILRTPGGIAALADAVLTLRSYGHTTESLRKAGEVFGPANSPLLVAMELWEGWLASSGNRDAQDVLVEASVSARDNRLHGVLIDGFTEILPLQWKIVETLVRNAEIAAVAIDPAHPPSSGLLAKFLEIGFNEESISRNNRWSGADDLSWLAKVECWDVHSDRPAACVPTDRVKIVKAADPRAEAAAIAREVAACVRDGCKYSDIAVLAPNLSRFRPTLESEFRRAGIPIRFFLDKPLVGTSPGALLDAILTLICGEWSDESVLRVLANPLTGIPPSEVREAITQTRAKRRLGSKDAWLEWSKCPTSDLLRGIARATEKDSVDPVRFAEDIIDLLQDSVFAGWRETPDNILVEEGWAWERSQKTLRDSSRALAFASGRVATSEAAGFLQYDLRRAKGRPLDRRRDCVNAVTLLGARTWGVPVAIVAGLAREYFPHRHRPNPFLPDILRERLDPPIPTEEQLQEREAALFRIAVTRAHDRLVLSWPETDSEGAPLIPCGPLRKCIDWLLEGREPDAAEPGPAISPAKAVFPSDVAAIAISGGINDPDLLGELARRADRPLAHAVGDDCHESPMLSDGGVLVAAACGSDEKPISPTALNDLAQCSYRFFASRLLRLKEPDRDRVHAGLDYLQWGSIAHMALARWFRSGREAEFDELVHEIAAGLPELIPSSATEADLGRMVDALKRFAEFEKEYILPLGFRQEHAELVFGFGRDGGEDSKTLGRVAMEAGGYTLKLGGIIDRVDIKDGPTALVIDYKRSGRDGKRVFAGRNFQLACYIALVEKGLGLHVGMACFLPLLSIASKGAGKVIADAEIIPLLNEDAFNIKDSPTPEDHLAFAKSKIAELIEGVSSGAIPPNPADKGLCGSHCPYRDLCRFRFTGDEGMDEGGGG